VGGRTMKASVLIPTYNKSTYLDLTLAGFVNQTDPRFEIIVVNDGGTDNTHEIIEKYKYSLNIKYYRQEKASRAAARNQALRLATGDIIILNDDDRIPGPEFVQRHMVEVMSNPEQVSIGTKHLIISHYAKDLFLVLDEDTRQFMGKNDRFVQALVHGKEGPLFTREDVIRDFSAVVERWYHSDAPDNFWDLQQLYGSDFKEFRFSWALATTANLAFHRSKGRDLFFDEAYQGWGVEDNDFAYQLFLRGYSFKYNREAHNYHQHHPRGEGEQSDHARNLARFCTKFNHMEPYLFVRVCRGEIYFIEANAIAEQLSNSGRELIDDYFRLCCHSLGF
jgi:glycosyltransferase involved in cell wall biosynthesis